MYPMYFVLYSIQTYRYLCMWAESCKDIGSALPGVMHYGRNQFLKNWTCQR